MFNNTSHIDTRDGLKTLQRRHTARYGLDSVYGIVHAMDSHIHAENPSFHQVHRNNTFNQKQTPAWCGQ